MTDGENVNDEKKGEEEIAKRQRERGIVRALQGNVFKLVPLVEAFVGDEEMNPEEAVESYLQTIIKKTAPQTGETTGKVEKKTTKKTTEK